MAGIVVIFDFNKTIIAPDSDNSVVEQLGANDLFNDLLPTIPWNLLMDRMMEEIHALGKTVDDVRDVLRKVPVDSRIVSAIKKAHWLGCDLKIVSDANAFFIETVLDHLGIKDYFSEIYTNPSRVDEEGRLRISPYIDFHTSPHGCTLCPPNMCKGIIIERIQASFSKEGKKRSMIYLGDGSGDFCPCLKLREGDSMMPRKDFPVWDLICENVAGVRAEIHEWSDGNELEGVLLKLIEKMSSNSPIDCKLKGMPKAAAHEALTVVPLRPKDGNGNGCLQMPTPRRTHWTGNKFFLRNRGRPGQGNFLAPSTRAVYTRSIPCPMPCRLKLMKNIFHFNIFVNF